MREGIHPDYVTCSISCSCGARYQTRGTKPTIHIEICSACHPVFTGKEKLMDTAGRVEKFRRKYEKGASAK